MRPSFAESLKTLLDAVDHPDAVAALKRCRSPADLDRLAQSGGWLTPQGIQPRVRLVKHGSGTFLLLAYDEGWGTTLAKADFWRA